MSINRPEHSQKSLHLKNKWSIWDHETKRTIARPGLHETGAENKTNYCKTETETKKNGLETTLVSRP